MHELIAFGILTAIFIPPFAGLLTLIIFYEWRRNERIKRGLHVDDRQSLIETRGFDIQTTNERRP